MTGDLALKKTSTRIIHLYPESFNPIREYADWIENEIRQGKQTVGKKIVSVYRQLIRNMDNPESEWEYRPREARHAVEFIERYCRQSKGVYGGQCLRLELWQKAATAAIFGFYSKKTNARQYTEVFLDVARKNGKSTWAAAVGLYMMMGRKEPGAEIYAVATKKDQAKIVWLEAKRMAKKSPSLDQRIQTTVTELRCDATDSSFRALGRDSDTLDGLNVFCALMDEVHAWNNDEMYDVVADGVGARSDFLILMTTTAGVIREHIYDKKYQECEACINAYENPDKDAPGRNDRLLPLIYELDDKKEWTVKECWRKANPGLGTIKNEETLEKKVLRAIANPGYVKNLLCKDFNVPDTSKEAWLTYEEAKNDARFDPKDNKPKYLLTGTDISDTTDLMASKVAYMLPNDPVLYVHSMYWIPEDLVELRIREDKIPYDKWIDAGYVRTCPGNRNDPLVVIEWISEIQAMYGEDCFVLWNGYDRWAADWWKQKMSERFGPASMIQIIQGAKTFTGPMDELKTDLGAKKINYNNNPVDLWNLCNTARKVDDNANQRPIKTRNPRARIDGTLALLDIYAVLFERRITYLQAIV